MIKIEKKEDCCGCTACAEICPRSCIKMITDEEGFIYPHTDVNNCISCNLCEKICPIINTNEQATPQKIFAAYHKEVTIRELSSSGGVFSAIAEYVIKKGGVVFGVCFDDKLQVIHSFTENFEGLSSFRGSKYVQSQIGNSYRDAERFLKQGRYVLFSGTPCQVAGLKHFLRKEYPNLITVDFICHGVPSPLVWKKYKEELMRPKGAAGENTVLSLKDKSVITGLSFRDKRAGWRKYGFSVCFGATKGSDKNSVFPSKSMKRNVYEIQQQNVFLRGFLQNLYLRPSCHHCQFRSFKSGSDMTVADYWGVQYLFPNLDDDKGLSLVIHKSERPELVEYLDRLNICYIKQEDYEMAYKGNKSLFFDDLPNPNRSAFWKEFGNNPSSIISAVSSHTTYTRKAKMKDKMDIFLLSLGLYNLVKYCVRTFRKMR